MESTKALFWLEINYFQMMLSCFSSLMWIVLQRVVSNPPQDLHEKKIFFQNNWNISTQDCVAYKIKDIEFKVSFPVGRKLFVLLVPTILQSALKPQIKSKWYLKEEKIKCIIWKFKSKCQNSSWRKTFICLICNQSFGLNGYLNKHVKTLIKK